MKLPQAWLTAGSKKSDEVNARIDMSAEVAGLGKCPECKSPMQTVMSNGEPSWACVPCRICLPLPDGQKE